MKHNSVDIAILGAGLTGLSAAIHLKRMNMPFRMFEKLNHPGGHVITYSEPEDKGFRFDKTGHLLHLRDPAMRELVMRWIGNDYFEVQRKSVIWSHGVYTRYPFQANTFGLPPKIAAECVLGFIHAHFDSNKPKPKNFEEFCKVHFGKGMSDHFMIPYNSRLWGVHPSEITADWCQRFVPIPKLDDVIAGAVGLQGPELGYNASFVYPKLGIGELSKAMAKEVPEIEYQKAPKEIDWKNRQLIFEDEVLTYRTLISTAPLQAFVFSFRELPKPVDEANQKLRCNKLCYLDVATRVPSGMDYHWIYVPEKKYPMYRIGCYSHFSSAMAPENCACFYVELADRNPPNMDTLMPEVASTMKDMKLISSPEDILFARARKIDHAYVVFDHHYFSALEIIFPFLDEAQIISTGRYGGWNYSSMEDALLFGKNAAEQAKKNKSRS